MSIFTCSVTGFKGNTMQEVVGKRLGLIDQLQKENGAARNIAAWMEVNLPEMECRGDMDCDHCCGISLLKDFKEVAREPRDEEIHGVDRGFERKALRVHKVRSGSPEQGNGKLLG